MANQTESASHLNYVLHTILCTSVDAKVKASSVLKRNQTKNLKHYCYNDSTIQVANEIEREQRSELELQQQACRGV